MSGSEENSKNLISKADSKKLDEARSLVNVKNYNKATRILNDLIENNPDLAEAFYLLGMCYKNEAKYLDAATMFTKAIHFAADIAEYYSMLAFSHANMGSLSLSEKNYGQALKIDEFNLSALTGLGRIYYDKGELELAKKLFSQAIEVEPSIVETLILLALIFSDLGDYQQALIYANNAVKQDVNNSNAMGIVGRVHLVGGNVTEAIKCFQKAIQLDHTNGMAYLDFVSNQKVKDKNNPIIKKMEKILSSSLSTINRQTIHFALGKSYNDCKEWDLAMNNFSKGNLLLPTSFDKKDISIFAKDIKKIFSPRLFDKLKNYGNRTISPIFIIGMPRSGSTLIDQVLSSHSDIDSVGESKKISDLIDRDNEEKNIFPYFMKKITEDTINRYATEYSKYLRDNSNGASLIVNKMLSNYFYLGFIAVLFPKAKIIHSMRHPLDSSISSFFTNFVSNGNDNEWRSSLKNIGFYYKQYNDLMIHWKKVLPIKILDVNYEDMVVNLEPKAREIIGFCGLEWESQCLDFYKSKRSVQTASVSQVRQPIYQSSLSRWPPYAKYLGPLVEELGDIVEGDYEQLRKSGCEFKVKKPSLIKHLFKD